MEILKEFYEENKEWLNPLISSLIDGKNVYDDNDLIVIDAEYKRGDIMPLSHFSIVKKGKNSDE